MPVISVNSVGQEKNIQKKKWRAELEERHNWLLTQKRVLILAPVNKIGTTMYSQQRSIFQSECLLHASHCLLLILNNKSLVMLNVFEERACLYRKLPRQNKLRASSTKPCNARNCNSKSKVSSDNQADENKAF
jgi:hypothetical protein